MWMLKLVERYYSTKRLILALNEHDWWRMKVGNVECIPSVQMDDKSK